MTSTSFTPDRAAEIIHDERSLRLVRLDFYYDTRNMLTHETLAQLGEGLVTIITLDSDDKPKKSHISPDNMTRLAHAWLKFLLDCELKLEQEKAEYQKEIDATRLRAIALGASMTDSCSTSSYELFTLAWPATHPLNRFNTQWSYGNENLSLSDVQDRLKHAEKHVQQAQIEACDDPRSISTFERQCDRVDAIGGYLTADADEHNEHTRYKLSFHTDHPFYGFWKKDDELTPGLVEYRLRYVEGVMKPTSK